MSSYAAATTQYYGLPAARPGPYDVATVPMRLVSLLREGWGALLIAFFITGSESLVVGYSQLARRAVILNGFAIILVGMFVARTLGGRAVLAFGYLILFEHNYFKPPNLHIFRFPPSMFLAILALILESFRPWRTKLLRPVNPATSLSVKIAYGVLLLALLTAQFSSRFPTMLLLDQYLQHYIYSIPFLMLGARMARTRDVPVFIDGLILLGVLVAACIFVYYIGNIRILFFDDTGRKTFERYGGLIRTANEASFFLGMCLVLAVMRIRAASGVLKLLLPVFVMGMGTAMIYTRSRGPVVLVGLMLLLLGSRKRWRKAAAWMLGIGGAGVVLVVVLGVGDLRWEKLVERFGAMGQSVAVRQNIMAQSFRTFFEHPLGLGESQTYMAEANIGTHKVEHSEYVNFLLRGGLQSQLALWALVALLTFMWFQARRSRWPNRPNSFIMLMLLFFLLTFFYEHLLVIRVSLNRLFHIVTGMLAASLIYAVPQPDDLEHAERELDAETDWPDAEESYATADG